ncbi:MAG: cobyrinate a,c-diamide synthase [Deltaproteobacteria bacterium]|nr:cobyrinate a,c-diamide synthase [Deltaproteobacteria bacterium]
MKVTVPRIVIGGTHSGTGKTSLAIALTSALKRRGLRVQTFKVGPDFLDPTYLTVASGRPCYNLDGWMMGKDYVTSLFGRTTGEADIAVIEGVMGLFDGADAATAEGSTAEIARWLEAPVLLVIDARGAARSIAALVKGYTSFEPDVRVAGVVANRCASDNHAQWLAVSLSATALPPLVGAVHRGAFPPLYDRHLGLVTADRHTLPETTLNSFADGIEKSLNVEGIVNMAQTAHPLSCPVDVREHRTKSAAVAVAYDRAFHFYYRDTLDEMEARGCELVFFSPLTDEALPRGITGLYLGGGYPEVHAGALSTNSGMRNSIRMFAESGRPVYAECGGLMYLSEGLETTGGERHPLAGVIPAWTRMRASKKFLGYVEATLTDDSLWGRRGDVLRGHEFHYSELVADGIAESRWKPAYTLKRNRRESFITEGFQCGNLLASYAHLHYASRPQAVERFAAKCGGAA